MKFFVGIIILINFSVVGVRSQTKQLTVGDTLPNVKLENIVNYENESFNTRNAKGKILIIDFWSTWCSSCVQAFPKLDSLQKKFKDDVVILPVTRQDKKMIADFWSKNVNTKYLDLPTITNDSILSGYFPHRGVPHVVWINTDGVVMGITDGQYVDNATITKVIRGEEIEWPIIADNEDLFELTNPLLPQRINCQEMGGAHFISYRSMFPHIDGLKTRAKLDTIESLGVKRMLFVNYTILGMYRHAMPEIYGRSIGYSNRVIFEMEDTEGLVYDEYKHYRAGWIRKNTYCYEALWPKHTSTKQAMNSLMEDIGLKFNIDARLEYRTMPCLALVTFGDGLLLEEEKSKPRPGQANYKFTADIVDALNRLSPSMPVLDETEFSGELNITLGGKSDFWSDITEVNRQLEAFSLQVIEVERDVEVLVISENQQTE